MLLSGLYERVRSLFSVQTDFQSRLSIDSGQSSASTLIQDFDQATKLLRDLDTEASNVLSSELRDLILSETLLSKTEARMQFHLLML